MMFMLCLLSVLGNHYRKLPMPNEPGFFFLYFFKNDKYNNVYKSLSSFIFAILYCFCLVCPFVTRFTLPCPPSFKVRIPQNFA